MLRRLVIIPLESAPSAPRPVWPRFAREFPSIQFGWIDAISPPAPVVDEELWRDPDFDPASIDTLVGDAASGVTSVLGLRGVPSRELETTAIEVLTRVQGGLGRRNRHSSGADFNAAIAAHRALHDLSKPLVRADYNHAIDVWQWVIRLDPEAGAAVQLAALFHDVERLLTESDVRVEHRAADYQAFKDAHALAGSVLAQASLVSAGWDETNASRVGALVAGHERSSADHDQRLLANADALSFFSLNSPGFLDYYGPGHSRRKIAWTLSRMDPEARGRLDSIRLRLDVADLLQELRAAPRADGSAEVPA